MKNLSTAGMVLGAGLATGCVDGAEMKLGMEGRLNDGITKEDCAYELLLDRDVTDLAHQETDAVKASKKPADLTYEMELHDELKFVNEGVIGSSVLLGIIENSDQSTYTVEYGDLTSQIDETNLGNSESYDQSNIADADIDYHVPGIDDGGIVSYLVTNQACDTKESDTFQIKAYDRGFANSYYTENYDGTEQE